MENDIEEKLHQEELDDEASQMNLEAMKNYIGKNGQKIEVNDAHLYYEKIGHGPQVVLLCVGLSGSIDSDYMPFMQKGGFDHEKFTVIAFEPRGHGNSIPPYRTSFSPEYPADDAKDAVDLMKKLGYDKFCFMGWCAGGNIGIVAAALYPECITKLIVWGVFVEVKEKTVAGAKRVSDLANWSEIMLKPKLLCYTEEYLTQLFFAHYENLKMIYETKNGDCVKSYLDKIKCPTLVLDLQMDYFTESDQFETIEQKIPNVKIVRIPDGKHAFHLKYPQRFLEIVEEFLIKS